LRFSLYSQDINLYLAPTADARPTWLPLMQTAACEGRAFVLSANQCIRRRDLPKWVDTGNATNDHVVSNGGGAAVGNPSAAHRAGKASEQTSPSTSRSPDRRRRRKSVTVSSGPHELCLPASNGQDTDEVSPSLSPSRRRPSVTVPCGPHELSLPAISGETALDNLPSSTRSESTRRDGKPEQDSDDFACRGGSCIIGPAGNIIAGPLWEDPDGLLVAEIDFDDCIRGKMDFDAAGSYSRNDAFKLTVEGLALSPP
jgi:nitrilase